MFFEKPRRDRHARITEAMGAIRKGRELHGKNGLLAGSVDGMMAAGSKVMGDVRHIRIRSILIDQLSNSARPQLLMLLCITS